MVATNAVVFAQASVELDAAIDGLNAMFARHGVGADATSPPGDVASLLADFAMADANALAARFRIDLRQPEFWQAGLRILEADFERFEVLVDRIAEL